MMMMRPYGFMCQKSDIEKVISLKDDEALYFDIKGALWTVGIGLKDWDGASRSGSPTLIPTEKLLEQLLRYYNTNVLRKSVNYKGSFAGFSPTGIEDYTTFCCTNTHSGKQKEDPCFVFLYTTELTIDVFTDNKASVFEVYTLYGEDIHGRLYSAENGLKDYTDAVLKAERDKHRIP